VVSCAYLETLFGATICPTTAPAIGEVDLLIPVAIVHDIACADYVGVWEINPGVAIGVSIVHMVQLSLAATDFDDLDAADISLLRDRIARRGGRFIAGGAVGCAGDKADPDVVLCDDGG